LSCGQQALHHLWQFTYAHIQEHRAQTTFVVIEVCERRLSAPSPRGYGLKVYVIRPFWAKLGIFFHFWLDFNFFI
jgi:hypothetical protein